MRARDRIWNIGMNYETTLSSSLNGDLMVDNAERNRRRRNIALIVVAILAVAGAAY